MKNLEFKIQINDIKEYQTKLLTLYPIFLGIELQTDTYFNVANGRLKLRESNSKSTLINYYREESANTKIADIMLYKHKPSVTLKKILSEQLGIKVIVNKKRIKYSINNAVFHLDLVEDLGAFLEVEVTEGESSLSIEKMQMEIDKYLHFFDVKNEQLIKASYSDLLIGKTITKKNKILN